MDDDYLFQKGWALKENQIFGKKGGGKRINDEVKKLLQAMFLNGNLNAWDKLNPQKMHDELQRFVESGEIQKEDVPKTSTIKNWISLYSREWKERATKAAIQMNRSEVLANNIWGEGSLKSKEKSS